MRIFLAEHKPRFIHLAPESVVKRIRRNGIQPTNITGIAHGRIQIDPKGRSFQTQICYVHG
jgi:hypothetical protein